jgi:excisionase family DNA binding protein
LVELTDRVEGRFSDDVDWPFSREHWQHKMNERWLSVEEIAAHLGVNPDTIYKWIERKKMPAHKVGRLWKFQASEVDAWVRGGKASETVEDQGAQSGS